MADNKPSLIDYLNLGLTIIIAGLGTYVTINISRSADHLSQNGLIIASATLLLDDSPTRREGGVQIVNWLLSDTPPIQLPSWEQNIFQQIAGNSDAQAPTNQEEGNPSKPSTPEATPPPAQPSQVLSDLNNKTAVPVSSQQVSNQLFSVIGGTSPRLFIEFPDADQADGAEALRAVVRHAQLNGQPVVVPKTEHITSAPTGIQLRYLKKADADEAKSMAAMLERILDLKISISNHSERYDSRTDIKPRTYELWFPRGQDIKVASSTP